MSEQLNCSTSYPSPCRLPTFSLGKSGISAFQNSGGLLAAEWVKPEAIAGVAEDKPLPFPNHQSNDRYYIASEGSHLCDVHSLLPVCKHMAHLAQYLGSNEEATQVSLHFSLFYSTYRS